MMADHYTTLSLGPKHLPMEERDTVEARCSCGWHGQMRLFHDRQLAARDAEDHKEAKRQELEDAWPNIPTGYERSR